MALSGVPLSDQLVRTAGVYVLALRWPQRSCRPYMERSRVLQTVGRLYLLVRWIDRRVALAD